MIANAAPEDAIIGSWTLVADNNQWEAGCSDYMIYGETEKNAESCQTCCHVMNKEFVFSQIYDNGDCGCYKTCDYAAPITNDKAKVYEYEAALFGSWTLVADNNKGEAGCSDDQEPPIKFNGKNHDAETCQTTCYEQNKEFVFSQIYDNGDCGCYKTCNYAAPITNHKAKVYEYVKKVAAHRGSFALCIDACMAIASKVVDTTSHEYFKLLKIDPRSDLGKTTLQAILNGCIARC